MGAAGIEPAPPHSQTKSLSARPGCSFEHRIQQQQHKPAVKRLFKFSRATLPLPQQLVLLSILTKVFNIKNAHQDITNNTPQIIFKMVQK